MASVEDAFIDVDRTLDRWVIGTDALTCSVRRGRSGTLFFEGLFIGSSDDALGTRDGVGALISTGGATHHLGLPGSDFAVADISTASGGDFVSLDLRFTAREQPIDAIRHIVARPRAGALEMWTEFTVASHEGVALDDLNALAMTVPAGTLEWISGLEPGDGSPSFTRRSRSLGDGETFDLSSPVLSSLGNVPFFSIGNGHRRFLCALAWSGGWTVTFARRGDGIELSAGLGAMSAVGRDDRSIEGPHAVVGVVLDRPGADVAALSDFLYASRGGRGFPALTTFNTWFLHGTQIDERIIRADMDAASVIGIELFQVDAGWYGGGRADAPFDFTSGLGSWTIDPERFPGGFAALRAHADLRGLRLGVWMEPERVALGQVGRNGLAEQFLAQQDGRYDPTLSNEDARDAQICLADPAARAWVLDRITRVIEEAGADNLKWDLNRWVACTRGGHGHPANGGNYEHTRALYDILRTLRQRFPHLLIENCAGGARRADYAMALLTDTAWMDDRTAPSLHVRYNLDGLLAVFPAPYLFSYVMAHPEEPIKGHEDIPMLVRSRMPGAVGITADLESLGERETNELHQQIELAKRLRESMGRTLTFVLTAQTGSDAEWRVVQQFSETTGVSLLFAYAYALDTSVRVTPRRIDADVSYELRSADRGRIGVVRGADLIAGGLDIQAAPETALQVLVLEPTASAARVQ